MRSSNRMTVQYLSPDSPLLIYWQSLGILLDYFKTQLFQSIFSCPWDSDIKECSTVFHWLQVPHNISQLHLRWIYCVVWVNLTSKGYAFKMKGKLFSRLQPTIQKFVFIVNKKFKTLEDHPHHEWKFLWHHGNSSQITVNPFTPKSDQH